MTNLKKVNQGTSEEYVTTADGVNISSVMWKDNGTLILLFTVAGKMTMHQVEQYERKNKKKGLQWTALRL